MRIFFTILIICVFTGDMFSQRRDIRESKIDTVEYFKDSIRYSDNVIIIQDERMSNLLDKHIRTNIEQNGIPGFRIRIFSELGTDARDKWNLAKARFLRNFPAISEIYMEYDPPDYKIYIGDFRTKPEAMKIFERIRIYFPKAFIVRCIINFPDLEKEKDI